MVTKSNGEVDLYHKYRLYYNPNTSEYMPLVNNLQINLFVSMHNQVHDNPLKLVSTSDDILDIRMLYEFYSSLNETSTLN